MKIKIPKVDNDIVWIIWYSFKISLVAVNNKIKIPKNEKIVPGFLLKKLSLARIKDITVKLLLKLKILLKY